MYNKLKNIGGLPRILARCDFFIRGTPTKFGKSKFDLGLSDLELCDCMTLYALPDQSFL